MKIKTVSILIVAILALVGFANAGTVDSSGMVTPVSTPMFATLTTTEVSAGILDGYNIAVANSGTAASLETGLENLGATVDLIDPVDITENELKNYDLLWIPTSGANDVDVAGVYSEILAYIHNGGGLILTQPNYVLSPNFLPYEWEITDTTWPGYSSGPEAAASTILNSAHPLTQGLTVDDMPDGFDTSGNIAPEYIILAETSHGEPTFGTCDYGCGKVIVELDAPYMCSDGTGDDPNLSDAMVERMVSYVACDNYGCNGGEIPEFPTVALPIAAILGLAFFFQRRN